MTNEEKALEIKHNDPCCVWNAGCPNAYNAALEMAKWKDEHPSNPYKNVIEHMSSNAYRVWKENLWHDAQGDDLPEIDREVIVLTQSYPLEGSEYAVSFAHRPCKKGYLGKSLVTGNIETYYPETYGKGGWSIPDVKWWLDVSIPNLEQQ